MSSASHSVLDAALKLPEDERAAIAAALLESLGPAPADDESEDALADELERRLDECRCDPAATISWSELRDQD